VRNGGGGAQNLEAPQILYERWNHLFQDKGCLGISNVPIKSRETLI